MSRVNFLKASGSWHRTRYGTFFCCSGHCVKYCRHWTDCLFCGLQELSRKQFWVTNVNKCTLLASLAQDLLSAAASEA